MKFRWKKKYIAPKIPPKKCPNKNNYLGIQRQNFNERQYWPKCLHSTILQKCTLTSNSASFWHKKENTGRQEGRDESVHRNEATRHEASQMWSHENRKKKNRTKREKDSRARYQQQKQHKTMNKKKSSKNIPSNEWGCGAE